MHVRPNSSTESRLASLVHQPFGTILAREPIDKDKADRTHDPDRNGPLAPEGGAYHTVDGRELSDSWYDLKDVASGLVGGKTESPLSGEFWLRAGGIGANQKDAYVWEGATSLTKAVDLTVAFPGQYNSI